MKLSLDWSDVALSPSFDMPTLIDCCGSPFAIWFKATFRMKIRKRLAALPLTALVALAPNVQGQSLGGIETEPFTRRKTRRQIA